MNSAILHLEGFLELYWCKQAFKEGKTCLSVCFFSCLD